MIPTHTLESEYSDLEVRIYDETKSVDNHKRTLVEVGPHDAKTVVLFLKGLPGMAWKIPEAIAKETGLLVASAGNPGIRSDLVYPGLQDLTSSEEQFTWAAYRNTPRFLSEQYQGRKIICAHSAAGLPGLNALLTDSSIDAAVFLNNLIDPKLAYWNQAGINNLDAYMKWLIDEGYINSTPDELLDYNRGLLGSISQNAGDPNRRVSIVYSTGDIYYVRDSRCPQSEVLKGKLEIVGYRPKIKVIEGDHDLTGTETLLLDIIHDINESISDC